MGASKRVRRPKRRISDDTKRDILNRLVHFAAPQASRSGSRHIAGHSVPDDPGVQEPDAPTMEWLGRKDTFGNFVAVARQLNILAIDAEARDLAFGHTEDRYFDGQPVYRRDPSA